MKVVKIPPPIPPTLFNIEGLDNFQFDVISNALAYYAQAEGLGNRWKEEAERIRKTMLGVL